MAELAHKIESGQGIVAGSLEQIERVDIEIDPANLEALSELQVAELLNELFETEEDNYGKKQKPLADISSCRCRVNLNILLYEYTWQSIQQ